MDVSLTEVSSVSEPAPPDRPSTETVDGGDQHHDGLSYRIPANPEVLFPIDVGALNPPPEVLERRTGDSAADLEDLRRRALAEALGQAAAECASTFELPER